MAMTVEDRQLPTICPSQRSPMSVRIGPTLFSSIVEHALADAPLECCGLLLGIIHADTVMIERVQPAINVHPSDRTQAYEIEPTVTFSALRSGMNGGLSLVGFYHSHPDGSTAPSSVDLAGAWQEKLYLILGVRNGEVVGATAWRLANAAEQFSAVELTVS